MTPLAEGTLLRATPTAPCRHLDELVGGGGVLVLAPHPDDETLGCGTLLASAAAARRDVHVVAVTDGGGSHPNSPSWPRARLARRRSDELAGALDVLGGGRITHECLEYPDQGTPSPSDLGVPDVLGRLATLMRARRLGTLLSCWEHDPHVDHERCAALAEALVVACGASGDTPVRLVRYPVWGRFVAAPFDDRTDELVRFAADPSLRTTKARALACHATQMSDLIDDDPEGFVMPAAMQRHFVEHDELFVVGRAP